MVDMIAIGNLLTNYDYKFEFHPRFRDSGSWIAFERMEHYKALVGITLKKILWNKIIEGKNIQANIFDDHVDLLFNDYNQIVRLEDDVYYTFPIGSEYSDRYGNGKAFNVYLLGYFYSDHVNLWYYFSDQKRVKKISVSDFVEIIASARFFYPRNINQKIYQKFVDLISYVDDRFFKGLDIHHVNRSTLLMLYKSLGSERFLNIYNGIPFRLDEYFDGIDLTIFDYDDAVYLYGILKNHIEELENRGIDVIIPKFINEKELIL